MIRKTSFVLLLCCLFSAACAFGQTSQTATDYIARRIQFQVLNPPQPVQTASVFVSGNPGPATYYYWIVTNTVLGASSPAGPFQLSNAPNTLSGSNFNQVNWSSIPDAISYDVLRTSTNAPPSGSCNCAVIAGTTSTTVNDQSNSLSAYTVNTFDPSTMAVVFQNSNGLLTINGPNTGAALSVGSLQITGGLGSLPSAQTVSASNLNTPALAVFRIDNSPPVGGANVANPWYAPLVRFNVSTTSGNVTGSSSPLSLEMFNIKGKSYTTFTANIVGSGVAQSAQVADSSMFVVGDSVSILDGLTNNEVFTVTAVPDGTHVSGVITKNHNSGVPLTPSGKGYKSGLAIGLTDVAGSTNDMNGENPNVTCRSQSPAFCVGSEIDMTNQTGLDGADFYGQNATQRDIIALSMLMFQGKGSVGIDVRNGDAVGQFKQGIAVEGGASQNSFLVTNGGDSGTKVPNIGFNVQSATTAGFECGANQTPATGPYNLTNPTDCIYLTALGTAATQSSNSMAFEERVSSANHVGRFQIVSSQLRYTYDGVWGGAAFDTDGSISTQALFRIRNSSNSTIGQLQNSAGTSIAQFDIFRTNGTTAATGDIRVKSGFNINARNNANTGDINLITKNASDVVIYGDTAGVALKGGINNTASTGVQHKRSAGCATAASVAATCTATITWTTAFADTNYSVSCTGDVITSGVPTNGGVTGKATTSVTFQTVAATAAAAQYTNIDCEAMHD